MTLHYASPLHSEEDPGGLIGEAFAMGAEFPGPAQDLLLSWMLRLPEGLDARDAAKRLLERYGTEASASANEHCSRLVELLRETAEAPAGVRKGGRRRREVSSSGQRAG
ncbi:MAG TPA: hypothetical protein VKY54_14480 [Kiloniellales bacterium]|jgi:hypothetical protein|nr:hypothetical protein [Kiloniellales bacterium]